MTRKRQTKQFKTWPRRPVKDRTIVSRYPDVHVTWGMESWFPTGSLAVDYCRLLPSHSINKLQVTLATSIGPNWILEKEKRIGGKSFGVELLGDAVGTSSAIQRHVFVADSDRARVWPGSLFRRGPGALRPQSRGAQSLTKEKLRDDSRAELW